ncbi:MAG: flagellar filament capping protein FliD [Pirellulales bacterium]|nr:flagellar filament capping protein FliD [Pirellulales bacterium]
MARVQSSVGLVTGINITETVNQLVAIQGRTRDLLVAKNKQVDNQRNAIAQLTAQLLAVQISVKKFTNNSLYDQRAVASSDTAVIQATSTGTPELGSYQYTAIRQARAQQLQSGRFTSATTAVGAGTFKFRAGGFINNGVALDELNFGAGFTPGKIKITNRAGVSAEVDLAYARTIDDVLAAINAQTTLKIKADVSNDTLRLVDQSGGSSSNLRVEEVNGGSTAASLGLAGINVASSTASGNDIYGLFGDLRLSRLRDGRGVRFDGALADLRIRFRDGSSQLIDFEKLATTGTKASATTTAANGVNAKITFTAAVAGPDSGGIQVQFVDNPGITAGAETASYNSGTKVLTINIDEGNSTADQVIAAVSANSSVTAVITAARAAGSDGSGLVTATDTATTTGPQATATTLGTDSPNAKLLFKAVTPGAGLDDVRIEFIDDALITGGNETVTFDQSNPLQKKLTFRIDQGNTNANDIIDALTNDPTASQYFTAANVAGSTGLGKVVPADSAYTSGGTLQAASPAAEQLTLQNVVDLLNAAAPTRLQATINNNRLQLTDLTADGGYSFSVEQLNLSTAARDLGLDTTASGGTITGKRLGGGLKSTLLESLNGGAGLGTLGTISLTDRGGTTAVVNLAAADTTDDVIQQINNAGLGILAGYNTARNGIVLTDTTGLTSSNLIIANNDATNTADKLGLTVNAAQTSKSSGDLKLQIVSEATRLSDLNGGAGVAAGSLTITDNNGASRSLQVDASLETVGDLLVAIESLGLSLQARINDAGDGIVLIDSTNNGASLLKVTDGGGGTGRDLHLLGAVKTATIDGQSKKIIDGSQYYSVELSSTDTLQDLGTKINALNGRVRATISNDGATVKPFQLNLFNQVSGKRGELLIDTSGVNFSLTESIAAQDALLQIGGGSGGTLASSASNTFSNLLPDVNLTLTGTSANPVTVTVSNTTSGIVGTVKELVDSYNRLRDNLTKLTAYNAETNTSAVLQGDGTTLRLENEVSRLVSGRFFGAGPIQSLQEIGVSLNDQGQLRLDESVLQAKLDSQPGDVQKFLKSTENGFAAKFDKLIEQLAGVGTSLLINRAGALTRKFDSNQTRVEFLNARLDRYKERLTLQFQRSELVISKLKANQTYLNTLSNLAANINTT